MKTFIFFNHLRLSFVTILVLSFTLLSAQSKQNGKDALNNNYSQKDTGINADTIGLRPEEVIDMDIILGISGLSGKKVSTNTRFAVKDGMVISWNAETEMNNISKVISLNQNNFKIVNYSVVIPANRQNTSNWESVGKNTIEFWDGNNNPKQAIIYFSCRVQKL